MHRNACCLLVLASLWAWPGQVRAQASVYLAQSTLVTQAHDGTGNDTASTNARVPWYHVSEAIRGPASATTTYDFSTDGDDVTFLTSFDHTRAGQDGNAATSYGFFTFVPMMDLRYTLEGSYASTGGGETNLDVHLEEMGTYLFNNVQNSISAGDHSFTLGGQDGDQSNELEGSMTGICYAYSEYILMHRLEIEHALDISSASATGDIRLDLTPAIPGDFDNDGDVDKDDLRAFDACANDCIVANVNCDAAGVNVVDLQYVKNNVFCTDEIDKDCIVSDVNRDGDVNVIDLQDVKNVVFCENTSASVLLGCEWADFDSDNDVDHDDYATMQGCISGANVPADPDCMN